MALPQIISRNQIQRIPTIALIVRKVLSGGTDGDFYTVPTEKKALIKGVAVMQNFGAAGSVDLDAASITIATWITPGGTSNNNNPFTMALNIALPFEVQLDAGDILAYTQSSGTNAEMLINAEILETPA